MGLHNYIRRQPSRIDIKFDPCDEDETLVYSEPYEHRTGENLSNADPNVDPVNIEVSGATALEALREFIAYQIQNS
ncbi:hypothetical protein KSP40_PGU008186 [Platanthera guangdongensis]|uniref:Uncharacterized protein n=1 Tax=Platanthera guangdongensis TaxID=2320717 RepID=A0ABR2LP44_9ASPA